MKFICLILILTTILSCEKGMTSEELQLLKLSAMRASIVNDWKLLKITILKPASYYGAIATTDCEDIMVYSFREDGSFNFAGGPCYPRPNIRGVWNLPKTDSLFIDFTGDVNLGTYEKLEVTKLTADTMKWNIIATSSIGPTTEEFTLIPK